MLGLWVGVWVGERSYLRSLRLLSTCARGVVAVAGEWGGWVGGQL